MRSGGDAAGHLSRLQVVEAGTGAVISLLVSAAVILLAGKSMSGVQVDGYKDALVAALIMALLSLVLTMLPGGGSAPPA